MQHMSDPNATAAQNYYLVPATTDATGAMSIAYMFSPRTTISGSASYGRTLSGFTQAQFTSANLGLSRKLTRNWFTELSAGGGYILPVGNGSSGVRGKQYEAAAGLGFRLSTHTLIGSVHRSVSDYYGMGAAPILSEALGWSWRRLGANWALNAGISQDHLLGTQFALSGAANNSIRANTGIYWKAPGHTSIMLQYAYVSFKGAFAFLPVANQQLTFAQHSIQLSFGWGGAGGPGGGQTAIASR